MSMEPENYGLNDQTAAREKANLPGIFLITVGVFNILLASYIAFGAIVLSRMTVADFEATTMEQLRTNPITKPYIDSGHMPPAED
jgi:hypothetical protein